MLNAPSSVVIAGAARLLSGATVRWVGCTPEPRQRVYFGNHTSHLDALVLWSSLPGEIRDLTRPVAAKDYWSKGAVRRYMARSFNAILIDREEIKIHQSPVDLMLREIGNKHSLIVFPEGGRRLITRLSGAVLIARDNASVAARQEQIKTILESMGERWSLIVFPEGTRGAGPEIAPFKSGLYHLSLRKPALELVPVYLDNVYRILPKGELLPVPMACCVTFGPPLALRADEPKEAFLERAREAVQQLKSKETPC